MPAPDRVEELRKRYHENPRRFFAPLANEYRKTGFVDRAILLCEKHLGEQPGNMNGLVVYGQCLVETGRLQEARQPFEKALELDPENQIALRNLGDIARRSGDDDGARTWYRRLLEYDRRNDEVIALLEQLGGAEPAPPPPSRYSGPLVTVAPSVSVAGGPEALGTVQSPSEPEPPATPAPDVPEPPRAAVPATPARSATPVDPSARTVEVTARPKPAPRGSLLDVSFDFGELGLEGAVPQPAPAPPAPEPLLPAEAAEYGFAPPEPEVTPEDALDALLGDIPGEPAAPPEAPTAALEAATTQPVTIPLEAAVTRPIVLPPAVPEPPAEPTETDPAQRDDALALAPLVDTPAEATPAAELSPIEGLQLAEYEAEVAPLAGLEPTEFEGGEAAPLADLEPGEFSAPRESAAIEGLETTEFTPPSLSALPLSRLSTDIELPADESFGTLEEPGPVEEAAPLPELPGGDDLGLPELAAPPEVPELAAPLELSELPAPPDLPELPAAPESALLELPSATEPDLPDLPAEPEDYGVPTGRPDPRASVAGLPLLAPLGSDTPLDTPVVDDLPLLPELGATPPRARPRVETPTTFVTETMARVYVEQGHTDKAIEVYRQLIAQSPDDAGLRDRLRALESGGTAGSAAGRGSFSFGTPAGVEPVDEPAPANAMLSAMSFEGVTLPTPRVSGTPGRPGTPVVPAAPVVAGPSAREFFARFARRAITPVYSETVAGPAAGGQLLSPLDALFGSTVTPEDEAAAHRLAGVGATSGPSGGSALDTIFGEGPSSPMPAEAPAARSSVARASQSLRFDQFFQPAASEPEAAAEPVPEPEYAAEAERAMEAEAEAEAAPSDEDDDDLDQFQGWLRGLTQ